MTTDHLTWNALLSAPECNDTGMLLKECHCEKCRAFRDSRAHGPDWCTGCDRHQDACTCAPVVTEIPA